MVLGGVGATVNAELTRGRSGGNDSATTSQTRPSARDSYRKRMNSAALRMARVVITAVLVGYVINALIFVWRDGARGVPFLGFVACLLVGLMLQLVHSTFDTVAWPVPLRVWTLTVQAVVTFSPFVWIGPQAGSTAGFLAGSMLLIVPGRWRWALFGAVGVAVLVVSSRRLNAEDSAYSVYVTILTGLMVFGVSSLALLVELMIEARGELALMAVARERLRVARDLHDLLGLHFSAIVLKSELAYRLLPAAVPQAREQLLEVSDLARRALAEVQVVAGGHRPMSLAAELASARSILSAAGIEVHGDPPPAEVPETVDAVLAIVMREAVTNVLRHSKAVNCRIEAWVDAGWARLRVDNDGVDEALLARPGHNGSGLLNLSSRLADIGGDLFSEVKGDTYSLIAQTPLPDAPAQRPRFASRRTVPAHPATREPADVVVQPWHLRRARLITVLVLVGYALLIMVNSLSVAKNGWGMLVLAGSVLLQATMLVVHSVRLPHPPVQWARGVVLTAHVAATVLPLLWMARPWGSMGGFLAGALLLRLSGRPRWISYGAVGAGQLAIALLYRASAQQTAYLTISTLLTGLVVYGISSLSLLVTELDRARAELARLAVTKERLRVAQELHDSLGEELSAMTAKTDLAYRSLSNDGVGAKEEVAEVREIGRRAVAHVRVVANGYRHMSLAAELGSTTSTLSAAYVNVRLTGTADEIPGPVDAVLALVLRESVTNVLRHSDASYCVIELAQATLADATAVRLLVRNDGVRDPTTPQLRGATGLVDLVQRLSAIGGRLTVETRDCSFTLEAIVPVTPAGAGRRGVEMRLTRPISGIPTNRHESVNSQPSRPQKENPPC